MKEERYRFIEGDKEISGGIYRSEEGKIIMQSRYERKLSWYEKLTSLDYFMISFFIVEIVGLALLFYFNFDAMKS